MAKLSWKTGVAATGLAVGAVLLSGTPALADGTNGPLCKLNSNAYQYNVPLGTYERTVHYPHSFRVHGTRLDSYNRLWYFGHSGESWWDDGYVLAYHVTC